LGLWKLNGLLLTTDKALSFNTNVVLVNTKPGRNTSKKEDRFISLSLVSWKILTILEMDAGDVAGVLCSLQRSNLPMGELSC